MENIIVQSDLRFLWIGALLSFIICMIKLLLKKNGRNNSPWYFNFFVFISPLFIGNVIYKIYLCGIEHTLFMIITFSVSILCLLYINNCFTNMNAVLEDCYININEDINRLNKSIDLITNAIEVKKVPVASTILKAPYYNTYKNICAVLNSELSKLSKNAKSLDTKGFITISHYISIITTSNKTLLDDMYKTDNKENSDLFKSFYLTLIIFISTLSALNKKEDIISDKYVLRVPNYHHFDAVS